MTQQSPFPHEPEDPAQLGQRENDDAVVEPSETGEEPDAGESDKWFDETWTKVHPLSPLVRGWVTIVAIPVAFFSYNWQMWTDIWRTWRSGELADNLQANPTPYLLGGGAFLVLALLIFVGFTLSWWFTRYKITEEHVMVKSGIFIRQHRQARIDRVQAVDLRQPLLARIAKLAELRFEVAEGDGTAATLAFLRKHEAEDLRAEIMDRAAGESETPGPGAAPDAERGVSEVSTQAGEYADAGAAEPAYGVRIAPPEGTADQTTQGQAPQEAAPAAGSPSPDREILRVPVGRLIGSVLFGGGTLVFLGLLIAWGIFMGVMIIGGALFTDDTMSEITGVNIPVLVPILIAAAFSYYNQISSGWKFTATMTKAGLRLRYGLLETNTQTVPPGRVQALQIQQGLLWRPFGWYRVQVTVAGYGLDARSTLLPVGKQVDVMQLTAEMFPDLKVDNPEELFTEGLRGRGTRLGFTEVPSRARIFDPLVRRRRGFFATPSALMLRDGWTTRRLSMVPHERIQSASLEQGPLARKAKIATLNIHIPAGPITARAKNQDIELIKDLFEQEAGYAATARRLADRNQWMKPEELHEFEKNVAEVVEKLESDQLEDTRSN
ncbi:PH domain-containing protein [Nesterenkonia sp. MY13]|uniref:PH domain-containing protein n=1 Tax=Nesterenkonia sedimenti TaxID=1463632 RepID=A0A7X8TJQ5_9MICC|nr:PH domain-containing protein [Nesterenkonia sedimenti]NLS10041.1 PH domain-containing protein [Nesterenkonia sedimenti]